MNQLIQHAAPPRQITVPAEPEDDTLDLASYTEVIYENRWFIAAVALAVTLIGVAIAFLAKPMYEASILIQVEDSSGTQKDALGGLTSPFDTKTAAAAEIEILKSRMVVSKAVDNLRLHIDARPKYFPVVGEWIARRNRGMSNPGLFGYGGYAWGAERVGVQNFNVPETLEGERFRFTALDGGRFELTQSEHDIALTGRVGETLKAQTGYGELELLVDSMAANPGTQFFLKREAKVQAIERLQNALSITERGKQSGIIGVTLEREEPKLASAVLNEIGREYIRQNVDRKSEEALKSLAFLNKQLPDLKKEMERSESAFNALRHRRGTFDLGEETKALLHQSAESHNRLVELKQKKDGLLARFQPEHPEVAAIDQQIRGLNREIASVDARIKQFPEVEQDVFSLTRDVKVNTELYMALLSNAQQLRLAAASKVGNARLLDTAMTPVKPAQPQRPVIIAAAMLSGLVLGVIGAFMRKRLSTRIEEPQQIAQMFALPVSATIPYSENQAQFDGKKEGAKKKLGVLSHDAPFDNAVESLRGFRASLQFSMRDSRNNIIAIGGPTPGVGKSFVSVNFAVVLASSGKKVLLIDGDLRTGYLHRYFGLERGNGLADVVAGKALFGQAIHKSVIENVDFLSTGSLPQKPSELLAHVNFGKLLQMLSSQYDFVLVDTPPLLAVADALAVASHAGAIFNVVRAAVTTRSEVEETIKRLNQAGYAVTGIVLNGLKTRTTRYGYGAGYGKFQAV